MLTVAIRTAALVGAALLLGEAAAGAEQPRLPRGDASVGVGWLHADVLPLSERYDRWASRRVTLNGQGGVYWTEHWKTEVSAERSNRQTRWQSVAVPLPNGPVFRLTEHRFQDTRVSLGQFYQFGHNAWAHVAVGAGVTLVHRNSISDIRPITRWDPVAEVLVEPGRTETTDETRASVFGAAAVKAYITPRVFVRSDGQLDFRNQLDSVVLRIGVGVDF